MQLQKVHSSNLSAMGYDEATETLTVEFVKGGRYEYYEFPKEIYKILLNAPSKGTAFYRYVRSKGYKYKKVA